MERNTWNSNIQGAEEEKKVKETGKVWPWR